MGKYSLCTVHERCTSMNFTLECSETSWIMGPYFENLQIILRNNHYSGVRCSLPFMKSGIVRTMYLMCGVYFLIYSGLTGIVGPI